MRITSLIILLTGLVTLAFFSLSPVTHAIEGTLEVKSNDLMPEKPEGYPIATVAGGCFWCVESEFRVLPGILHTRVGYIGGKTENPTYQDITTGTTGHAEAVDITYDPKKITYTALIEFFLTKAHDPTQLNRQGVDVGTQYRSAIFYHDDEQKKIAENLIKSVDNRNIYGAKVVTKLSPATTFWLGEDYHQQYYEKYEEKNGEIHPRVFFKKKMKQLKGG